MTTNIDINSTIIALPTEQIRKSKLFANLVDCYHLSSSDNLVIPFPTQYNYIVDVYLMFINKHDLHGEELTGNRLPLSFKLSHFIEDNYFFDYLTQYLLARWSYYNISKWSLTSELEHEIYLHCPYMWVPEPYRGHYDNEKQEYNINIPFLISYMKLHSEKQIHINNRYYWISNMNTNLLNEDGFTCYCLSPNSTAVKDGLSISWYQNNIKQQVRSVSHYVNNKLNGVKRTFFDNGKIASEVHYNKNVKQGLWKFWYKSGNLRLTVCFDDGSSTDVTWHEYYDSEHSLVRFESVFDDDKLYSHYRHYYKGKNKQLKYELEISNSYSNLYTEWDIKGNLKGVY
jgi:hypothetical protein